MNSLTIALPIPPKELHPNHKPYTPGGCMAKARATAKYKRLAYLIALHTMAGQTPPRWERATMVPVFFHTCKRRRDRDNLAASLKAGIDGIVKAGLMTDDNGLVVCPPVQQIDPRRPRVELTFMERGSEDA